MTGQPARIGLIGDGPVADAYAAAIGPMTGVELVRAAGGTILAGPELAGVIVTTLPAALDAIAQGKPGLADLSGGGTAEQVEQLGAAALSAGVTFVIARPWRFHEVARTFRASAAAGELGPPAFFHWIDEGNAGWPINPRLASPAPAAGALAGIDLALWLLGERPARVYARATGGDGVTISLRCRGGATALIERRSSAGGAAFAFAWLLGPRGEVRWDQRADGVSVGGGSPSLPPLDVGACLRAQVAAAVAGWAGTSDPAPEVALARWVASTISAANDSLRLGRPVTIATAGEDGDDA